jgi:hypothetical protein
MFKAGSETEGSFGSGVQNRSILGKFRNVKKKSLGGDLHNEKKIVVSKVYNMQQKSKSSLITLI